MNKINKNFSSTSYKGTFCISFDMEMLWGRHDLDYTPFISRARRERDVVNRLLKVLDKYKSPATWAVVGELFTPETDEEDSDLWHSPDIIKSIREVDGQEIASHSFSHPEFPKLSREEAVREIEKSVKVAKELGIKLESFVFPRNKVAHMDVLKKFGFLSFRGKDSRAWEMVAPTQPPVYKPFIDSGLVNIPGSLYFVSARGIRRYIPSLLRKLKARAGIDRVIAQGNVFHLWTHPTDFTDNTDSLIRDFDDILRYANEKRKEGQLDIKSMGEIAREFI